MNNDVIVQFGYRWYLIRKSDTAMANYLYAHTGSQESLENAFTENGIVFEVYNPNSEQDNQQ